MDFSSANSNHNSSFKKIGGNPIHSLRSTSPLELLSSSSLPSFFAQSNTKPFKPARLVDVQLQLIHCRNGVYFT